MLSRFVVCCGSALGPPQPNPLRGLGVAQERSGEEVVWLLEAVHRWTPFTPKTPHTGI